LANLLYARNHECTPIIMFHIEGSHPIVVLKQTVGIPMGTYCAPRLADLFLFSYEAEFMQNLAKCKDKSVSRSFNFTYRYIDDVLSINNPNFFGQNLSIRITD